MRWHRSAFGGTIGVLVLLGAACARQHPTTREASPGAGAAMGPMAMRGGMMGRGMMGGGPMMGMSHDSATMAQMGVIHELVMNHDRITRTVTNLPNGVRTATESDDPRLASLIKDHVARMNERLLTGSDPQLPMETPAVHAVFRNHDKINTTTEATAKGLVVVQTSSDSATVAALQQHASELSTVVREGMSALHAAMMKQGGMEHPDTSFAAMQERGKHAMGVDQYTSTHHFEPLPDGGRIELQRDVDDSAGVAQIRQHLQEIAKAFAAGDFRTPAMVHSQDVPGTKVMAAKRDAITYTFHELPRGGEVRILTKDPEALAAIRDFLAFQRRDHHAP